MGFSTQEPWSGLPCPPPGDLPDPGIKSVSLLFPAMAAGSLPVVPLGKNECKLLNSVWLFATRGLYNPWNSPGQNTGVGSHFLLQRIFPTQGLNPGPPHCRQILYCLSQQGSPRILELVVYSFSRGSSWPRYQTGTSCIAGRFFTNWDTRETYPFSFESIFTINIRIYINIQLYNLSIFVHSKMHYPLYLLFRLQVSAKKRASFITRKPFKMVKNL